MFGRMQVAIFRRSLSRSSALGCVSHRCFSASSRLSGGEPPIIDSFEPNRGFLRSWRAWSESTLAIVNLRQRLPGWGVPTFRGEAGELYRQVSLALAAADVKRLKKLTTPSCYALLADSVKKRPAGQRHAWEATEVAASVKQVRLAHNAKDPDRQYAQVTCSIAAKLVWVIEDASGAKVGGLGTAEAPYATDDYWVFERLLPPASPAPSMPLGEEGVWRIKSRLVVDGAEGVAAGKS